MSTFLLTSLIIFLVWLALVLFSNSTRREQLLMSMVGLVLSPAILLIVSNDYRNTINDSIAGIGIEDLLFSFSLFGIAAVLYQVLIGKHIHKLKNEPKNTSHPAIHWFTHLILVLGLWMFVALLLIDLFEIASIRALIISGLMIGIYIIAQRKDLLLDALFSGLFTAILVFLSEQIFFARLFPEAAREFWQLNQLTTTAIGGIPIEEILWAAVVGFTIGPMYEWLRKYELK